MCRPDVAPAGPEEGGLQPAEAPGGRGELRRRPAPGPSGCARGVSSVRARE